MSKNIYNIEKEVHGNKFYWWNAILKYAGKTFRLIVFFRRKGESIHIHELTDNGWVYIADDFYLNFDRKFDINLYDNTDEVMTYTRKVIEKAMLNFITDVFGNDACVDTSDIKSHVKELSEKEDKPKEARDEHIETISIQGNYPGNVTDEELENMYF